MPREERPGNRLVGGRVGSDMEKHTQNKLGGVVTRVWGRVLCVCVHIVCCVCVCVVAGQTLYCNRVRVCQERRNKGLRPDSLTCVCSVQQAALL